MTTAEWKTKDWNQTILYGVRRDGEKGWMVVIGLSQEGQCQHLVPDFGWVGESVESPILCYDSKMQIMKWLLLSPSLYSDSKQSITSTDKIPNTVISILHILKKQHMEYIYFFKWSSGGYHEKGVCCLLTDH
jgi:hypothetical protein